MLLYNDELDKQMSRVASLPAPLVTVTLPPIGTGASGRTFCTDDGNLLSGLLFVVRSMAELWLLLDLVIHQSLSARRSQLRSKHSSLTA